MEIDELQSFCKTSEEKGTLDDEANESYCFGLPSFRNEKKCLFILRK